MFDSISTLLTRNLDGQHALESCKGEATPRNPKFQISIYNYLEDKRANRTLDGKPHVIYVERAPGGDMDATAGFTTPNSAGSCMIEPVETAAQPH